MKRQLKKTNILFKKIKWLWVDNFNKLDFDKKIYKLLKKQKVKVCLVSPELVKKSRLREIKKRSIDITFIGSLYMKSGFHINRINLIYILLKNFKNSYREIV